MAKVVNMEKVECKICGEKAHFLEVHLTKAHDMSVEDYESQHPGAPVLSEAAKARLAELSKLTNNSKVDFDIKKTFGVSVFARVTTTQGFENSHPNTPEVDPDYNFDKSLLGLVLYALNTDGENMLLSGPTGSGKSSVVEQTAARLNLPFYRVNFDLDIARADFVGQWVLDGKDMAFQYGILPRAMREGAVLLLDEWDCANPAVAMALQAVLDGGRLMIAETGETIIPASGFRMFATANTLGQGDESGMYNGTQPQNFAQLDRFGTTAIVDYLGAREEKKILKNKTGIVDNDVLDKLYDYAKLVREAFKKEEIRVTMSTRSLINVGKKIVDFGDVKTAYMVAFINKASGDDREFCLEILQRVWGV